MIPSLVVGVPLLFWGALLFKGYRLDEDSPFIDTWVVTGLLSLTFALSFAL